MSKLVTFATVVNVLSQPALGNGLLWMARAMSGEQGGCFPEDMQPEIGAWIAHTILNRVQNPAYPSEPEAVVRKGFFGYQNSQDTKMLEDMYLLAFQVLIGRTVMRQDITGGCYFMFSLDDLEKLGKTSDKAVKCFKNGQYGLCFFRDMP